MTDARATALRSAVAGSLLGEDRPRLNRTLSTVERQTLERGIEIVSAAAKRLQDRGLSTTNFFLGVSNCLFVAWSFGGIPQHFWIVYISEACVLFPVRFGHQASARPSQVAYWLDLCWVANFVSIAVIMMLCLSHFGVIAVPQAFLRHQVFAAFWGIGCGPLLLAGGVLGNALIFHDADNVASVLIHLFPSLVMYNMRFHADAVREAWPQFRLDYFDDITGADIIIASTTFYLLWVSLYLLWLVTCGMSFPQRGYDTIFHYTMRNHTGALIYKRFRGVDQEEHRKLAKSNNFQRADALIYVACHAGLSFVAILTTLPSFFYSSFHLLVTLVVTILVIYNGAKRYTYYTTKLYCKLMKDAVQEVTSGGTRERAWAPASEGAANPSTDVSALSPEEFDGDRNSRVDAAGTSRPRLQRTLTTVERQTLERGLEIVSATAQRLQARGLSTTNFFLGVCNCLFVAWSFGRIPQHFWLVYLLEACVLFPARFSHQASARPSEVAYWFDFCWVANFASIGGIVVTFLDHFQVIVVPQAFLRHQVLAAAWGIGCGPLLLAGGFLGNALIFHDADNVASVLIHLFPSLVMYNMRFHADVVHEAWPQFKLDEFNDVTVADIVLASAAFYLFWASLYLLWLVTCGMSFPKRGYDTMFHYNMRNHMGALIYERFRGVDQEEHRKLAKSNHFQRTDALIYVACHSCLSFVAMLTTLPSFFYSSFHLLVTLIVTMLVVYNGAKRYTYYTTKLYCKLMEEALHKVASGGPASVAEVPEEPSIEMCALTSQ